MWEKVNKTFPTQTTSDSLGQPTPNTKEVDKIDKPLKPKMEILKTRKTPVNPNGTPKQNTLYHFFLSPKLKNYYQKVAAKVLANYW